MKRQITPSRISAIRIFMTIITGAFLSLLLVSFTAYKKMTDDFLKQLGISKADANIKIGSSLLEGYLDGAGVKNIKNIALGNRAAITRDLLVYTKQYLGSAAFIKEYNALRERKKPVMPVVQTPEELQQETIDNMKKSIAEIGQQLKKADASMKVILEKALEAVHKQLKVAEDPNNKSITGYRRSYPDLVKSRDANYEKRLAEWEAKYPANHLHFIKQRLLQFLDETKDIDFGAELYEKKGIKYFSNKEYEAKNSRWKMAFRAGKEVVEPARAFVQEWVQSIQ